MRAREDRARRKRSKRRNVKGRVNERGEKGGRRRKRGKGEEDSLDMKENSLCLKYTLMNQEPLPINCFKLCITHSTI